MDKGLQEVIAKLNSQKSQVSQQQKPLEKAEKQIPDEDEVSEDEDTTDPDFYEDTEQKTVEKKSEEKSKVEIEMELLNNNGRYRAELLYQLQELNKALVVIAQVLMQKR